MIFLVLFIIPLLIAAGVFIFGGKRVSWKEFLLQVSVQAVIAGISVGVLYYSNTSDWETWNGAVTGKEKRRVSCSHSYPCNCREVCSGSGKNRSCSTVCQTCYRHPYDYSWTVYASTKESFNIARLDSQGLLEPPRWTLVKTGDPVASTHMYTNYIKAAPDTLFRHAGLVEKFEKVLPTYPNKVYDYYHMDRMTVVGGTLPNLKEWNEKLELLNSELGPTKQSNVVVVFVFNQPRDFYYALEQKWIGGKKNDTVVVLGVDDQLKTQWTEVMAWSKNPVFQVTLRDDLMALPLPLTADAVLSSIKSNVISLYERKPMKDFEYLASSITPTPTQWIVSLVIGFLAAVGMSYLCYKEDIFNEENQFFRRF